MIAVSVIVEKLAADRRDRVLSCGGMEEVSQVASKLMVLTTCQDT